jgi:4-hydroxy-3-methylbut-2-enyl diphosphate reductase IspH
MPVTANDDLSDIHPRWLHGTRVIGLTADASAHLIDAVITTLARLGPITVTEHETIHFTLPSTARRS